MIWNRFVGQEDKTDYKKWNCTYETEESTLYDKEYARNQKGKIHSERCSIPIIL